MALFDTHKTLAKFMADHDAFRPYLTMPINYEGLAVYTDSSILCRYGSTFTKNQFPNAVFSKNIMDQLRRCRHILPRPDVVLELCDHEGSCRCKSGIRENQPILIKQGESKAFFDARFLFLLLDSFTDLTVELDVMEFSPSRKSPLLFFQFWDEGLGALMPMNLNDDQAQQMFPNYPIIELSSRSDETKPGPVHEILESNADMITQTEFMVEPSGYSSNHGLLIVRDPHDRGFRYE